MYPGLKITPSRISQHPRYDFFLVLWILLALCMPAVLGACPGRTLFIPEASFEASSTRGQAPLAITFTNTSKNADDFQWIFGDGTTGTTGTVQESATHEYKEAGSYTVILRAVQSGDPPQESSAHVAITVEPDVLSKVVIDVTQITLTPGEEHTLSVQTLDRFDNQIEGLTLIFESNERAGQVNMDGKFTAGTQAGVYPDAITVQVTQGAVTKSAKADVTVRPGGR